jgi:pimeloyl-ACP methyl ester carboxylesterase
VRLRVLTTGRGPDLVLLHGSAVTSAMWVPWLSELRGYRVRMVDLPGHGLSGPVSYRPGEVRQAAVQLIDELLGALDLDTAPVIAHSVGAMYALWHAAERPGKISRLILMGAPGGALPGLRLRVPVNLLTLPGIGQAMLRMPSPRPIYRGIVTHGMGSKLPAASPELIDVLRLSARQPASAASVTSLHRAADRFTKPRPETIMTDTELASINVPVLFCWGRDDPFLAPAAAAPHVARMPRGRLQEVPGAHVPWLDDPSGCGRVVTEELSEAGVGPHATG